MSRQVFKCIFNRSVFGHFSLILATLFVMFLAGSFLSMAVAASVPSDSKLIGIEKREDIRVVYDVRNDVWEAGVGKALFYVRGLIDAYRSLGVGTDNLHISVVLSGKAAYWLLGDEAYRVHVADEFGYNPNRQIVEELIARGVSVELCNATMKARGWQADALLPGVKRVHDAYTRIIDLQQRGYAYIRF